VRYWYIYTIKRDQRRQTVNCSASVHRKMTHWVAEAGNVVMETHVMQMLKCRESVDYEVNAVRQNTE